HAGTVNASANRTTAAIFVGARKFFIRVSPSAGDRCGESSTVSVVVSTYGGLNTQKRVAVPTPENEGWGTRKSNNKGCGTDGTGSAGRFGNRARLQPPVGGGFAGDHLVIGEDYFAAHQFGRVDRFEAFDRVGLAVTSLRGFVLENKEVQ